jgi:hypothetical protein
LLPFFSSSSPFHMVQEYSSLTSKKLHQLKWTASRDGLGLCFYT